MSELAQPKDRYIFQKFERKQNSLTFVNIVITTFQDILNFYSF